MGWSQLGQEQGHETNGNIDCCNRIFDCSIEYSDLICWVYLHDWLLSCETVCIN